jgi:hypothetical protein
MKSPKRRGGAIDDARFSEWDLNFRNYRKPPDRAAITEWLDRFATSDRDTAARILDAVEVFSEAQIQAGYKASLAKVPGWHSSAREREGRWFFVGFGSAGESGLAMARVFREANKLTAEKFNYMFCSAAELPSKKITARDTIVLIDDFSGSGRQICNVWPTIGELIAAEARCFLLLTAATKTALEKIKACSPLRVIPSKTLGDEEDVFSKACGHFTLAEKASLLTYCVKADKNNPKGFGSCGLLCVLSHKTPNNSIPILHVNKKAWKGLFPRYLNP